MPRLCHPPIKYRNSRNVATSLHANANVGLCPHALTVGSNASVPLDKVRQSDLLIADDLLASVALGDVVELPAVGHHARLGRLRCLNAVTGRGGGGWLLGSSSGRGASDDTNADIDLSPQARTVVIHTRVPLGKVSEGDFLAAEHLGTARTLRHVVELVAVRDHSGLGWLRCLNAVSCGCSGRRFGGRDRGSSTNDADTDVHFGPQTRTVVIHTGIPLRKVTEADLLIVEHLAAVGALLDVVELVTVGNHSRLSGHGSGNTIAGRGGGTGLGSRRGSGGPRSRCGDGGRLSGC